ncbi:ABC transporter permease [Gottschalkiaceae bacterium SANA]|nr:ABC transporter permease [Gottschalkiaceae bacterium SANA]
MYFKLARKNVKKSIKDFAVYFLTLVFGVSVFYMFNSLDAQQELMAFTESQQSILVALTNILAYFSVFVSIVLGFLIVYANGFLIRRRKQELGMYMLLGMEKWKIARVLIYETMIIGVVALGVGLGLGTVLSQLMSIFTAMLFEVNMTGFHFIFSLGGAGKAIMYFGLIFAIAVLFSAVSISRYKLIDLFQASRKNEELKIRSLKASIVIFVIAIVCLVSAYALILKNGLLDIGFMFTLSILLGSIGTFLFFMSLSGFMLRMVQANSKLYFKNLNMFVLRQINSKINTTYVSMTIVCLVLLLTIGTFSSGMGISMAVSKDLTKENPYEYTLTNYWVEEEPSEAILDLVNRQWGQDAYGEVTVVREYDSGIAFSELPGAKKANFDFAEMGDMRPLVISLSDLNGLRKMNGQESIQLASGEVAFLSTNQDMKNAFEEIFTADASVPLANQTFALQSLSFLDTPLELGFAMGNFGTFVLRDDELPALKLEQQSANFNFEDEVQAREFDAKVAAWLKQTEPRPNYFSRSRTEIYDASVSTRTILSFLSIYLGFVFLITCAAILALQQLSEAADNRERYELLRKIGTEKKMINQSIFFQVFLYFMMPLGLAIVHSIVGLKVANDVIRMVGEMDIVGNLLITAVFILVIYGGYFLATYLGVKAIVAPKFGRTRE